MNEERKVNLEGIFYNEDGTFIPQTDNHGNIDRELAYLRNTYMESEKKYFEHLLTIDSIRKRFFECFDKDSNTLLIQAKNIQEQLEIGNVETKEELEQMKLMTPEELDKFHMYKLECEEGLMCLLFAAARDKVKILELIKTYEEENSISRAR